MSNATRWMLAIFFALASAVAGLVALASASFQGVHEPVPEVVLAAGAPAGSTEDVIPSETLVLPPAESHAWFVVPDSKGQAVVLHVPPRRFARPEDGKLHGSEDGTLRIASRLESMPSEIAAWGDRLYLLEDRPKGFESTKRLISSIRAVRSGVGDLWATYPAAGLDSHPSLTGEGDLISFVGTSIGPAVLLQDRDPANGHRVLRVRILADRSWVEIALPKQVQDIAFEGIHRRGGSRSWAKLISSLEGLQLLCGTPEGIYRWKVACDRDFAVRVRQSSDDESSSPASDDDTPNPPASSGDAGKEKQPVTVEVAWGSAQILPNPSVRRPLDSSLKPEYAGVVSGKLVLLYESGLLLQLWKLSGDEWKELDSYAAGGSSGILGVAPLDGVGRLAMVWPEGSEGPGVAEGTAPVEDDQANREVRHQILEVSVFTGREMFSGRWKFTSPLAPSDLRLLSLALMGAMSLVIVFVLKAESNGVDATLPPQAAFAGPIMRATAGAIDLAVALLIAGRIHSLAFSDIFTIESMLNGQGVWTILTAFAIAAVIGAFCEAAFGRTLGKLITGCEVIDSRVGALPPPADGAPERDTRPPVFAAILRNVLKWLLPPVGLLALLDAQGRHPADRLCKTAVIVWLEDDEQ